MKVFNFFTQIFAILAFLTLGSFLVIVSLHILSVEDAVLKLRVLYDDPWQSSRLGLTGLLFILVGLSFAKAFVKKGRETDAIILQSEIGPIVVSSYAIEDSVKKVLKRFHLVKECKLKTIIRAKDVQIRLRVVLWSGADVPLLLSEIQQEVTARLRKLLGKDTKLTLTCDVQKIEDHQAQAPLMDHRQAVSI